ncbi:hypothetical protein K0A97_02930 [Patescibacteria group bacterium]|nr:hypothetical protein [Patescibacteria group bacterium]
MIKKILFFLLILIFISSSVSSLGITPGRTTINFEPGLTKTVEFTVINSEEKDVNLVVLVQGELNQSISLSDISFSMGANEREKKIKYTLNLPQNLEPGLRTSEIVVVQLPEKSSESQAFIGAAVGVATQIYVYVPYPGKYAEASLNIVGPDEKGVINFVLPVISRGDLDLVRVNAVIDIYSSLNEKIETIKTNEIGILSGERKELVAKWEQNLSSGKYKAIATLIYDENTKTLEKEFNIGYQVLEIQNIEVNNFRLGEIAKFEVLVQNKWGEPINNAFAEMLIYNNQNQVMAEVKSPNYNFPALEKALMILFWDTGGVRAGTYDSELFLKFGEQSSKHNLKLDVSERSINVRGVGYVISEDSGEGGDIVFILGSIIVLLVVINLFWFLFLRRKLLSKKKDVKELKFRGNTKGENLKIKN